MGRLQHGPPRADSEVTAGQKAAEIGVAKLPNFLKASNLKPLIDIDLTASLPGGYVMALERELQTYKNRLTELLAHEGKFVLIRGDEVAGTWDTYEDALRAGYDKFGLNPFLVKRIL